MSLNLKRNDEIWSEDGLQLGLAHQIYSRVKDVNPVLKLYAQYLHVYSTELGDDYYVPLDFITEDRENGRFTLTVTLHEAMERGWSRLPNFILNHESAKEELPET